MRRPSTGGSPESAAALRFPPDVVDAHATDQLTRVERGAWYIVASYRREDLSLAEAICDFEREFDLDRLEHLAARRHRHEGAWRQSVGDELAHREDQRHGFTYEEIRTQHGWRIVASRSRWTLTITTLSFFLNESAMTSRSHLCARGDMSRSRLPLLAAWAFGVSMTCAPHMASAQDSFENPGQALREPQTSAPKPKAAVTAATWGESDPAPAGYHLEHHWRRRLVVGGAGVFVLAYAFSAAAAAASSDARALWIPIGGPVIQMTQLHSNQGDIVQANGLAVVLLVFDCIAQTVGAGMVTYGLAVPETRLVKNSDASFWIAPSPVLLGRGAVGVGVVGSF